MKSNGCYQLCLVSIRNVIGIKCNAHTKTENTKCHGILSKYIPPQNKSVSDLRKGWWFSPGTPISSTNKTDRHDITEIWLKVALNIIPPFLKASYPVTINMGGTCFPTTTYGSLPTLFLRKKKKSINTPFNFTEIHNANIFLGFFIWQFSVH